MMPVGDRALVPVRVTAAFVHSDVITGGPPDASKMVLAVRAPLGCPVPLRRTGVSDGMNVRGE